MLLLTSASSSNGAYKEQKKLRDYYSPWDNPGMSLTQQITSVFSEYGCLAEVMPDFRSRPQQIEMAQAIAEAIEQQQQLLAEAGTGTGKTYAYLVPALLSGGKVIISTGTKTLQDQLFQRDLPAVRDALKVPVSVAMLKGRANYLCHYHLQRASQEGRFLSREDAQYIPILQSFAEHSQSGDKADLIEVPEQSGIWQQVTSTRDNCIGQDCQFYKQCFVMEARKQALAAEVVVVNHHLFFADVMLRDEGVAELLPSANTVIFDEAHQLPEIAGLFFGEDISTAQLMEIARDSQMAYLGLAKDCEALNTAVPPLEKACRDFRLLFQFEGSRMPAKKAQVLPDFNPRYRRMLDTLSHLAKVLETQAGRDPQLEKCWQRAEILLAKLVAWFQGEDANLVRWVEIFSQSVQLHATPLSVADGFGKQLNAQSRAWIFTSATLAVKNDFSHYQSQMGLMSAHTRHWQSPFDYDQQALLYVPAGMPDPNSSAYTAAVASVSLPVLQASRGRAFVLCTSLKAMREVYALLRQGFEELGLDYPLLIQGETNRTELLERFRAHGNAVLVGSQSFWEGVDVRGEALSCVIIDKLPFAPPDDPVLAARIDKMNADGKNAFMEYQLPYAVITLKQGAGRLIRDENDSGVLMICDPRLVDKPYGRRIWQSLPAFKRTRVLDEVRTFFESL